MKRQCAVVDDWAARQDGCAALPSSRSSSAGAPNQRHTLVAATGSQQQRGRRHQLPAAPAAPPAGAPLEPLGHQPWSAVGSMASCVSKPSSRPLPAQRLVPLPHSRHRSCTAGTMHRSRSWRLKLRQRRCKRQACQQGRRSNTALRWCTRGDADSCHHAAADMLMPAAMCLPDAAAPPAAPGAAKPGPIDSPRLSRSSSHQSID